MLSSGNLKYQPADRQAQLDLHLSHAAFVRDAGGLMIQVIDEKPKDRPVTPDDYRRLADMLNTLGERTKALGVPLVYHHHMNSTGEAPAAIEAIMEDSAASAVGLLFDIAHYQQGGGDPVKAIRRYGKAIKVVHLKDVRPIDAAPGYQWVELGRGRVDVKGCVAALKDVGFDGWAIVELDRVVDPGGTPKASAAANRDYVVSSWGCTLESMQLRIASAELAMTTGLTDTCAHSHRSCDRRRRLTNGLCSRSLDAIELRALASRSSRCGSRACRFSDADSRAPGSRRIPRLRTNVRAGFRVVVIAPMRGPRRTTRRVRFERTRS